MSNKKDCPICRQRISKIEKITQELSVSDWMCSICHDDNKEDLVSIEGCSHVFHFSCIEKWIKREACSKNRNKKSEFR